MQPLPSSDAAVRRTRESNVEPGTTEPRSSEHISDRDLSLSLIPDRRDRAERCRWIQRIEADDVVHRGQVLRLRNAAATSAYAEFQSREAGNTGPRLVITQ